MGIPGDTRGREQQLSCTKGKSVSPGQRGLLSGWPGPWGPPHPLPRPASVSRIHTQDCPERKDAATARVPGGRWQVAQGCCPSPGHVAQALAGLPVECSLGPRVRATGGGGTGRRRLRLTAHTGSRRVEKRSSFFFFPSGNPAPAAKRGCYYRRRRLGASGTAEGPARGLQPSPRSHIFDPAQNPL